MDVRELVRRVVAKERRKLTHREICSISKKMGIWYRYCPDTDEEQKRKNVAAFLSRDETIKKERSSYPTKYGFKKGVCPIPKKGNGPKTCSHNKSPRGGSCADLPREYYNRMTVWDREFGNKRKGLCPCCGKDTGRTITIHNFVVGHKIAHAECGSEKLCNLMPICRRCNGKMHKEDYTSFKRRKGWGDN